MAKLDFGNTGKTPQIEYTPFLFTPAGAKRTYGVRLVLENENHKKHELHYQIDVICLQEIDKGSYLFELDKNQQYVDRKAPNSLIDELALRCGGVCYPLQIKVDRNNEVITIANHTTIISRWEKERELIKKSYENEEIHMMLDDMDTTIHDIKRLNTLFLERDWFIPVFFTNIYSGFTKGYNHKTMRLPVIPYHSPAVYEMTQQRGIPYHKGDTNITRIGRHADQKGEATLRYQLYQNSPLTDAITAKCTLELPSGKKNKINLEIYNLVDTTPKSSVEKKQEEEKIRNEQPKPKKKKRGISFLIKNSH